MPDSFVHQLLTLPDVTNAELSPDGRWIAFGWYRVHANLDVFAVPADGSAPPFALTDTAEETRLVRWTPDSRAVLAAADHDGDEHDTLYRVALARPGVMEPLTAAHPAYYIRGANLDPTGRMLYYAMNYDATQQAGIEPMWIYRHDLQTGERVPIARPAKPAITIPVLNAQGTHILYGRKDRDPSGYQMHLVDVEGGEDREILNAGDALKTFGSWFPDGEHVLVLAESRANWPGQSSAGRAGVAPQEHLSLGIYHWPSGSLRWLIDDPARTIDGARVTRDGLVIVYEVREARQAPTCLDPATGTETPFPRLPGNLFPAGKTADDKWTGIYYAATTPAELVRFDLAAQTPAELVSLTRIWERITLDRARLTPAEDFRWTAPDGLAIQGWLYRSREEKKRAVLFVHGGPTFHSEDRLNPVIQYLCAAGFTVLDVNYRGSTGFGLRFQDSIKVDGWGGREQTDIASGAQALIRAGIAAPGCIGVMGTSYGGYSAWFLATHYPRDLIAAAVPVCGMTDLVVDYQTTRPDLRPYSEEMMGGTPEQVPQRYYERSPINFVQQIAARLLIVQGAQDPNVTPENVRQIVMRLDAHHIPYELLVFDDEGHGIHRPPNQERLYARIAGFFDAALRQTQ